MCGQVPSGLTPLPLAKQPCGPLRGERDFADKYPAERGIRVLEGLGAKGPQPLQKTTPLPLRLRAVVAWRLHAGGGPPLRYGLPTCTAPAVRRRGRCREGRGGGGE